MKIVITMDEAGAVAIDVDEGTPILLAVGLLEVAKGLMVNGSGATTKEEIQ